MLCKNRAVKQFNRKEFMDIQSLIFERPEIVCADTDFSIPTPPFQTFDAFVSSLKKFGPLVGEGTMGPSAHSKDPFQLSDRVSGQVVFGWAPNTHKIHALSIPVIFVGAAPHPTNPLVLYVLAEDATKKQDAVIRGFRPVDQDKRIFAMAYKNFEKRVIHLHPGCPQPHTEFLFSEKKIASFIDSGSQEEKCHAAGQAIFDYYKKQSKSSQKAEIALSEIFDNIRLKKDGLLRGEYITRAWSGSLAGDRRGVGDDHFCWQA